MPENQQKTILDLCGGSGAWSKPYSIAGYRVIEVDIEEWADGKGRDVRLFEKINCNIHGILAAPPCTDLSSSGARWWSGKGECALINALSVADACLRMVVIYRPKWWALENPVGRLSRFYGKPVMYFHPCDYGNPYTKKTGLWGEFNMPARSPVVPIEGSKMHRLPPSENRARLRSETPEGFASAFFKANP